VYYRVYNLLHPRLPVVINVIWPNTLQQFVIHSRDHGHKTSQNCQPHTQHGSMLSAMCTTGSRMAQGCPAASMKVVISMSYLAVAFWRTTASSIQIPEYPLCWVVFLVPSLYDFYSIYSTIHYITLFYFFCSVSLCMHNYGHIVK
jgi:hypothetical protein